MSNYRVEIGKRVRDLREQNRLTQANLAELLDCSVKHISQAERGLKFLSLEKYLFLSDYFDCSIEYLLKGAAPSDVTYMLPSHIVEVLSDQEHKERDLLLSYLQMYEKLRNTQNNEQ